jgi:hypothetical protein
MRDGSPEEKTSRGNVLRIVALMVLFAAVGTVAWMLTETTTVSDQGRRGMSNRPYAAPDPSGSSDSAPSDYADGVQPRDGGSIDGGSKALRAGERVTLQAAARETSNDPAFVLGEGDRAMLVVAGRDTRDGSRRARGLPAPHGLDRYDAAAKTMTISGIVMPQPPAEDMYSWGLTPSERAVLNERGGYLRADRITYDGGGAPSSAGSAPASGAQPAARSDARPAPIGPATNPD